MTELIPGKRYRLTVEGEAIDTDSIRTPRGWCIMTNREGIIEPLPDPLPTTPGSVICTVTDVVLMRRLDAGESPWVSVTGTFWREDEVQGATVLFDAGAERA